MTPEQIRAAHAQAEAFAARSQWDQAIACHESILAQHPDEAHTLVQLSYVHSLAGHYRLARAYALRANAARPADPQALKELAARLRTFNEVPALLDCIGRTPASATPIPLLLWYAAQLSHLNEQERALALLDEAKRGDPQYPATRIARAQVLTYLGRFDEAEADLHAALRRAPEIPQTYWLLSRLPDKARAIDLVNAAQAQLQRPGRGAEEIALLALALHNEYDRLGDYAAAARALEQSCRARRSRLRYQSEDTRRLVDALVALPPLAAAATSGTDPATPTPIFIIGMHRSGTTLLEQMLDGHADVRAVGELYDFTSRMRHATDHHCRGVIDERIVARSRQLDFAAVGAGYLQGMAWRLGEERFFTDKLPSNFLNAGFICAALPQAKLLHMVRDPVETCFSNLREWLSDAYPHACDQREMAAYYRQYQRLMAHWRQTYPGRILDVDYRRLTREPETMMREVSAFCGLPFEPSMLAFTARKRGVSTASAVQVRQGIQARAQPKWTPYAAWLQPLIDALGDL
ncbi:MAG: sulfotransferase [Pseudoxanthomonas sp.]